MLRKTALLSLVLCACSITALCACSVTFTKPTTGVEVVNSPLTCTTVRKDNIAYTDCMYDNIVVDR